MPLREDEDWSAKLRSKDGEKKDEDDVDDEAVKPLEKEDLPTELRKFIDQRGSEKPQAEEPKDPVQAVQSMVSRLKKEAMDPNAPPRERPPPPATLPPRGMSARQMTLEDVLQHLPITADPKYLKIPPTRRVDDIVQLAADRFSKL